MKSEIRTSKWLIISGIVVTLLLITQPILDIPRELKATDNNFFDYLLTETFYNSYLNPNVGVLMYLVGYALVWKSKLLGAVVMIFVSILGLIFSEYSDIRFMYVFMFLIGFAYFISWNDDRKRKNNIKISDK